ncbi:hypothetical protein CH373_02135 [Leptospira perolatii]|uniref:Aminotransferase class I/classII large domain-containing protein n=1 Tax=Leptospira perolatii TaxID=2023191 RepID=A0A2M9ZSB0_9LEPT|nr:PLP-dependent aminotransferase family protein [Leptospira perolatii]PJZ71325.1 hypothetical protein CH360_02135 [Leptospira perolatii]PJZ74859.1 hypothetical protein CH373_02135 [Leptospira perolatii]
MVQGNNESKSLNDLIQISSRAQRTRSSAIREILSVIDAPGMLSFAGGLPDESLFPIDGFRKSYERAIEILGPKLFQYSSTQGCYSLRSWIHERYYSESDDSAPDQIIITSGSQQALDLLSKFFINEGDTIFVERPSYLGALQVFSSYGGRALSIRCDSEGPGIDDLKQAILKFGRPKFFYGIPDNQNPTSRSYSTNRRKSISELLEYYNIPIIEDTAYYELDFLPEKNTSGERGKPSFAKLLPNHSFSIGTFSKTLSPGLRMGWLRAPKEWISRLISLKQSMDLHSAVLNQEIVNQFLRSGEFETHLEKLKATYSYKASITSDNLYKYFGEDIRFEAPTGGMFFWLEFPDKTDTSVLFDYALKENVAFVPGCHFYSENPEHHFARWNLSHSGINDLEEGVGRLHRAWKSARIGT